MTPRVLAVTSEPPWPLDTGGHIRSFHLLRALTSRAVVRLVCPVTDRQQAAVAPLRAAGIDIVGVSVGPREAPGEAVRFLGSALRGEPYVMYRRHAWNAAIRQWKIELAGATPDVLYFDHLDSLLYRDGLSTKDLPPSVIDMHNVYSRLADRTAHDQSGFARRMFLAREARLLAKMERRASEDCSAVMTVSEREAEYFRGLGAPLVRTIPNGVDCDAVAALPTGRPAGAVILFLGTMSWEPNASAARFLAHTVLPIVRTRFPDATLLIVGHNPPDDLRRLNGTPGIEVTGRVDDVKPYLRRASALAVPLDAGGGTRLKILEAFAAGLPVMSTRVGAEGIEAQPATHFVEIEREGFAAALVSLFENPAAAAEMAERARVLAAERYDWKAIGTAAADLVMQLATR